jgi:hypothetical protein
MAKNKQFLLVFLILLPISAFVGSVIQQIYHGLSGWTDNPLWIGWIGDGLITLAAFLFRYVYADMNLLNTGLKNSDGLIKTTTNSKNQINPYRFLNLLPYTMLVGTIASIAIHYNFLIGMGVYFIMQIMLIISFSGIVNLKLSVVFSKRRLLSSLIIIGGWLIYMLSVFFVLILPGLEGLLLYFVPLYVLSLILMGTISYLQLPYNERSIGMRIFLALGATSFVFSDTIIGITFSRPFNFSAAIIQPTFILAIALITSSILFESKKKMN